MEEYPTLPGIYTETLAQLLINKGFETESQDSVLTSIINLMLKFPEFKFTVDEDDNDKNLNFSMINLFLDKFDIREIGAETEELFLHYWKETTNELLIKYVPKIQMWLKNFNDLFKFTVQLTATHTDNSSNDNLYYLNPVSTTGTNLKVQDKTTNTENRTITNTRDVLQSVWGKTRADIMEKILNLKDIYNDCLNEFETLFMGVI